MPSFFSNDYRTLISYLVSERKRRGITQMQLAHAMRIAQTVVSRIERCERRIDAVEFFHICALLGVSTEKIYGHLKPRFAVLETAPK